jgi:hypothetical protein
MVADDRHRDGPQSAREELIIRAIVLVDVARHERNVLP